MKTRIAQRLSSVTVMTALIVLPLAVAGGDDPAAANATVFGPNVYVFDAGMPAREVQGTADRIFAQMESNQFGSERYALLFKPGEYGVTFNVGFYTQVAGLGRSPDDVHINGGVNVRAQWMPNANATCNFWRTLENFSVTPSSTKGVTRIAVSQAAPLRRLHVRGELHLFEFDANWNAGWASGGFLADSVVDGQVVPASQQQWLCRNSRWARWSNCVWNMVFVGSQNEPAGEFPGVAATRVERTPIIREKPYLFVDQKGDFSVFVPELQQDTRGVSWAEGRTPGRAIPISKFFVAQPSSSAAQINAALTKGQHVLFTPGIYSLDQSLVVSKANTILLGLGVPSLVQTNGQRVIQVADVDGVTVAGLILEAGDGTSTGILEVGPVGSSADHSANPTFLYDLTIRTGGAMPGSNDVGIVINSNHVVADQLWIWRADHGRGVGWDANPSKHGLVVNGEQVTIYGLFNEHHEQYQTLWNGSGGRVYFYQSEIPYDVPNQDSWMSGDNRNGYASYKVANQVTTHEAWGLGVYCYFRDAAVKADSAIEAPAVPGVKLHNLTTIWLNGRPGSEISHVVNELGDRVYANSPAEAMRQTIREFPE